jgi:transcriptional regulator with XRE-family HTH domain
MKAGALVARNIRRLRVDRELSQEMLAFEAGIDRTYVSRLERGMENPTVAVLEKLAGALSSDIEELFTAPRAEESPNTASTIAALQLFKVFLTIESEADRKKVLDLAKQLAPLDADAKT